MSQQVLTVEYDGETIISKPFDFEAMCLIDDNKGGMLRRGDAAVSYLFEGTKITDNVLNNLSASERAELSFKVYKWFQKALQNSLKNE